MTKKTQEPQKSAIAPNTVIQITIPKDEAQKAYDKTLNKLKTRVSSPGFRKGQVPAKIAEEQLGERTIIEEALQIVVPEKYNEAIKKENKSPISQPEFAPVQLEKGKDWIIEAHIAEKPAVTLKGYKAVVKKAKTEAAAHIKEQAAAAKAEFKKAVTDTTDDKAAKPQAPREPTEQELKDHQLHHVYQALIESVGPDIPEILVKDEVRYELENLVRRLEGMNMKLDDFLKHQGVTFEQLSAQLASESIGRLQLTFVLDALAQEEKLAISEKEINEQVDKIEDETVREQQRQDAQYRALIEQTLKRRKVAEYLAEL